MDSRRLPLSGNDRKLAEEVMFLHSLWRQGPPPNRTRSRNPTLGADLRDPGAPPPRDGRKRRQKKRIRGEIASSDLNGDVQPSESGGLPWPVEELPPPSTEWPPEKKLRSAPEPAPPPTSEEQAKVDAAIARQKALKASQLFFEDLYKEDEEGSEEDDNESIEFEDDLEKLKIYTFFIDIFTKDPILRQHYENSQTGEFNCLACAGIGMKGLKKYNNPVAILQHAHCTVTAKRKKGHRAFARALCKVLGYNFNMLPSLVLDAGERLGESLAKDVKAQKEAGIEEENQEHVEKQENENAVEEENTEDDAEEENMEDDVEEENTEDDAEEETMEDDVEEENTEDVEEETMEDDVEEENTEDDPEEENIEDDVEEENIEGAVEKAENKEDVDQVGNKDAVEEENIEDAAEEGEDIFEEVENKDAAEHENTENSVEKGENIDAIEDENPPENITNNLTENPLESSFQ
ncbi:ring-infected erythrocyte surface antigen-like [Zingiber officinale]|nr:ring-infected erythrocyte surface antigen-like [Zingiber officinale]